MKKNTLYMVIIISLCFFIFFKSNKKTSDLHESETIVAGTNAEFPPYEFVKNGTIQGFDIDLIRALETILNKKIVIKDMDFNSLLLEAERGSIHLIISALTPSPEREKKVLFTQPYLENDKFVIISLPESHIHSLEDLRDKKVVVNDGFTAALFMKEKAKEYNISLLLIPTVAESIVSIKQGNGDAYVSAQNAVRPFFERKEKVNLNVSLLEGSDAYAIALSKKYPKLFDEVTAALTTLEESGILKDLRKKWNLD